MLKGLWFYLRDDVRKRIFGILFCAEIPMSLAGAYAARWAFKAGLLDPAKMDTMMSTLLTYATISFGFCVAAISIIINIPNVRFAKKLAGARLKKKTENLNAYSDLLFIFGWTAMWHWLLIAFTLIVQLWKPAVWRGLHFGAIGFITCYSLCLFLVMLLAITQFGNVYIKDLRESDAPGEG